MISLVKGFEFYEESLRALGRRQEMLSSNVANNDTPNYHAKDFDYRNAIMDALGDSVQSSSRSLSRYGETSNYVVLRKGKPGLDGNNVDVDLERTQMAENAIKYESLISFAQIDIKNLLSVLQG